MNQQQCSSLQLIQRDAVQDEELKNLMMAWYYAGYYTGLYQGQQQARHEPPSAEPT